MAAIEKINQDITALKQAIGTIAEEICGTYSSYLTALGQAVHQQLIMASYHLCTRVYPETFLGLSLTQRQHLQQALKQMGQQAEQQLQSYLQLFFASKNSELTVTELESLGQASMSLEQAITEELRTMSRAANHLLESCQILPSTALEVLLEVAAKAEDSGSTISGPPNLLTALIETKDSSTSSDAARASDSFQATAKATSELDDAESILEDTTDFLPSDEALNNAVDAESTPTAIVAIYLRLDEIEFTDSTAMAWHNQVRQLSARLATLLKELEQKRRERTIAEAQAAWHSSWPGSQPGPRT